MNVRSRLRYSLYCRSTHSLISLEGIQTCIWDLSFLEADSFHCEVMLHRVFGNDDVPNIQFIAEGAGQLVDVIKEFTAEKQGFVPQIILVSPPEIGPGIKDSQFYGRFSENAIAESKKFSACYKAIAEQKGCAFLDAAAYIDPSEADSLHLTADGHRILAEKLFEIIKCL